MNEHGRLPKADRQDLDEALQNRLAVWYDKNSRCSILTAPARLRQRSMARISPSSISTTLLSGFKSTSKARWTRR